MILNIDFLLLQVWLSACFSARVKLRRTCAVRITAPNLGFLASDVALLCHTSIELVAQYYHVRLILQPLVSTIGFYGITSNRKDRYADSFSCHS